MEKGSLGELIERTKIEFPKPIDFDTVEKMLKFFYEKSGREKDFVIHYDILTSKAIGNVPGQDAHPKTSGITIDGRIIPFKEDLLRFVVLSQTVDREDVSFDGILFRLESYSSVQELPEKTLDLIDNIHGLVKTYFKSL